MDQNQPPHVALTSTGDHNLLDLIDQSHTAGLATMLVGIVQVVLGAAMLPSASIYTVPFWSAIFLTGGGWSLIGIGYNILSGRGAFDEPLLNSERTQWFYSAIVLVIVIAITAVAAFTVLA